MSASGELGLLSLDQAAGQSWCAKAALGMRGRHGKHVLDEQ